MVFVVRWLRMPWFLAGAVVTASLVLVVWPLNGASTEWDEGVYWQSLRAMSAGHPLFTSVFSSQPPLFLLSLHPVYAAFGQTLGAARAGIVVFAIIGLASAYVAGRAVGGRAAGLAALVLLGANPLYQQESRTLQAEVPGLALETLGVAIALLAIRQSAPARRWMAVAAGMAVGLGIQLKLFDLVALAPVGLCFLALVPGGLRGRLLDLGCCIVGATTGIGVVLLPFAGHLPAVIDQVVRYHMLAARTSNHGLGYALDVLTHSPGQLALIALAGLAAAVSLAQRRWTVLPLLGWAGASVIALLLLRPLYPHHWALLLPPLTLTVAAGWPCLVRAVEDWRARLAPSSSGTWAAGFSAVALVGVVALGWLRMDVEAARVAAGPPTRDALLAAHIARSTAPGTLVVTDNPYIAGLANRDVPPQLVDPAATRMKVGLLTAHQAEAIVQQSRVGAILFDTGRFNQIPAFPAWVKAHYSRVGAAAGTQLYLKARPHARWVPR
jgi:hypothetical protein